LEKLFLAHFFEDDTEIDMPILLAMKQKKGESIKAFMERFQSMALRCSCGMSQSTLVKTYRIANHTPRPDRSSGMPHLKVVGATRRSSGGNRFQIKAEEKDSKSRPDNLTRCIPESSSQPSRKNTLET